MIVTLGPEGTFSHEAAKSFGKDIHFVSTLWDVFDTVKSGRAEKGVVPIENTTSGSVGMTYDCLLEFGLFITDELLLPIHHHLVSLSAIAFSSITTLYVQPETLSQCQQYIRKHLPKASIVFVVSNADAAQKMSDDTSHSCAAITTAYAAKLHQLFVIAPTIEDYHHNLTRFLVIAPQALPPRMKAKTSIAVEPASDRAGLLYQILGVFADRSINLTRIESRPVRGKPGRYLFFIDLEGDARESNVRSAFDTLSQEGFKVHQFGSYRRSEGY